MALVTLTCPLCGLSKDIEKTLLPAAGAIVTCPRCKGRFPLRIGEEKSFPLPGADAAVAAVAPPPDLTVVEAAGPGTPPPSAAPSAAPDRKVPEPGFRSLNFTFTGNAKEYFGIWMVNTLLRVVTLGFYSPWAKVRKRRYFHANTLLDDAPFDYLADPLAILKGWLIAGVCLALYSAASRISPLLSSALALLFASVYPWVVVRSRIFTLRNTSHRNIRFSFRPNYRDAYKVYLWWPLLIPLTLGILSPYVVYRQKRFLVENSNYGSTPFQFEATPNQYVRIFLPLILLVPLGLAAAGGAAFLLKDGGQQSLAIVFPAVTFAIIYLLASIYIPIAITNVTWNATRFGGFSFDSSLKVLDLAWIYFSNAIVVVCTLGLLTPWASVRLARYRLSKVAMYGESSLEAIVATGDEAFGATGEELGDMLGLDLGL